MLLKKSFYLFNSFVTHFNLFQYVGKRNFESVGAAAHIENERGCIFYLEHKSLGGK